MYKLLFKDSMVCVCPQALPPLATIHECLDALVTNDTAITALLFEHLRSTIGTLTAVPRDSKIPIRLKSTVEGDAHHIGSPLAVIQQYLQAFFDCDPDVGPFGLENLRRVFASDAEEASSTAVHVKLRSARADDSQHLQFCRELWHACDVMSDLIYTLAAPASYFQERGQTEERIWYKAFDDDLSSKSLNLVSSMSLAKAFERAKAAATGPKKHTSILRVTLLDATYRLVARAGEEAKRNADLEGAWPLHHWLALGVGPEEVVIWNSWKRFGPRLDQHIQLGGARVRT